MKMQKKKSKQEGEGKQGEKYNNNISENFGSR